MENFQGLSEEEGELQKRYYRLERMREKCGDADKKLLAFLDANQKHFNDIIRNSLNN
ncbi:MAG: hypothetical protein J6K43_16470 [Lachnospiraceae bacterium]|nr:hypothetical protein [Lachnospiraceae bacterium]